MSEVQGPTDDDGATVELIRASLEEQDELPAAVRAAAQACFAWRTVDEELAEILEDSAVSLAGTRAARSALRTLTLGAGEVTIELAVAVDRVLGQVVPPVDGLTLLLQRPGAADEPVSVDDLGTFVIEPAPETVFRLRSRGQLQIVTAWIS